LLPVFNVMAPYYLYYVVWNRKVSTSTDYGNTQMPSAENPFSQTLIKNIMD